MKLPHAYSRNEKNSNRVYNNHSHINPLVADFIACNKKELPIYGEPGYKTGSFVLLSQDGEKVTESDVDGKIRAVEFFFTTCKSICPKMNSNMKVVYNV